MKIYAVVNCGVEHHSILGMYESLEKAQIDLDFFGEEENRTSVNDDTFQERWIKIGEKWYNQTRYNSEGCEWPEWPEYDIEQCWYGDRLLIEEHETQSITFKDRTVFINQWQNAGYVHPLTCGNNSNHPNLVPWVIHYPTTGIALRCPEPDCDYQQEPDHPTLCLIYQLRGTGPLR